MDVQALCLKAGKAVRDLEEFLPYLPEVAQAFLQPEVGEIVRANLIAQEGGELLVLFEEGILPIRAENVVAVFDLLQRRVQFPLQLLRDPFTEDL